MDFGKWIVLGILVYLFAKLVGLVVGWIDYGLIRPFVCRWRQKSVNKKRCPYLKCKNWRTCPYYDRTDPS